MRVANRESNDKREKQQRS